jgi:hypothetical protein
MTKAIAWWLLVAFVTSPLNAQQRSTAGAVALRQSDRCSRITMDLRAFCGDRVWLPAQDARSATAWSIAASAILPGSGQAILGANRALPYVAVETFAWTSYVRHSVEYRRDRDGYRDLASRVARAAYSAVRPNGNFEYYERMTHYPEAGRYDLVAGGGIEPETDSTTFNGAMWLLARRTFWADPSISPDTTTAEWKRAVAFYRARAYDQLYRWSWTHAPLEYSAFIDLIRESNDANRRALQDLGVIIANHVLSTVDAYITVRLRRGAEAQGFALEGSIPLARFVIRGKGGAR